MPRTLDAALLAAMNSGNFTPYFNLQLMDSNKTTVLHSTTDIIRFEMQGLTAQVEYYDPAFSDDFYYFRLQRGITVAGVPNVITSSCFTSRHDRREKRVRSLAGHLIPPEHFSCAGDQTYKQVIDAVCANFGFTAVYAEPAAAYLSYQFYPTGRTLVLNDSKYFFTILRAKYLVFACDLGNEQIYFYQTKATYPTYPGGYTLITAKHISVPGQGARKYKSFLSRDESATIHLSGSATNPMHNLGFLHSTASHPARTWFVDTPDWVVQGISPNLKYLDFDSIRAVSDSAALLLWPALFREIYDQDVTPSWQYQARYLDCLGSTEGGTLPGTIEQAAPYTPLNVTNFHGILDNTDNNLQAAMETIDDHTHTGYAALGNANIFTAGQKIDVNSATALWVEQDGVHDNVFVVDTTNAIVTITGILRSTGNVGAAQGVLLNPSTTSLYPIEFSPTSTASTTGMNGVCMYPQLQPQGNVTNVTGIQGQPALSGSNFNVTNFRANNYRVEIAATYAGVLSNVMAFYVNGVMNSSAITIPTIYGIQIVNQGLTGTTDSYGLYILNQTTSTNPYALVTAGGIVIFNSSGTALSDFTVKTDTYNAIFIDASNESIVVMSNAAGKVGFYGVAAVVQPSAYTQTYATASKTNPNMTASNPPAGGAGATAGAYDTAANRDLMIASLTATIADVLALKKLVNSVIDDLQALGLVA